ncbi:hypothetical protein BC827DRAFT_803347 [Russula dissimulans]|nr:hypothetical protein BC827DRAFT_803347 [Russula dissimulans]
MPDAPSHVTCPLETFSQSPRLLLCVPNFALGWNEGCLGARAWSKNKSESKAHRRTIPLGLYSRSLPCVRCPPHAIASAHVATVSPPVPVDSCSHFLPHNSSPPSTPSKIGQQERAPTPVYLLLGVRSTNGAIQVGPGTLVPWAVTDLNNYRGSVRSTSVPLTIREI